MSRLALAAALWVTLISSVSASFTPRKEAPIVGPESPPARASRLSSQALEKVVSGGNSSQYVVTGQTEVLLDGKPCKYEDVPAHATIVRMETALDKRTILRIHFRSRK